jgi:Cu+-exporting ATPase
VKLTIVLGGLLGLDLLFGALGWSSLRTPGGISLAMIAALIGAARIVYGALEALFAGRIGADIALAQACIGALIIGEPFVAAEVVFIALVGEVLEAITFARTQKEIHRLLEQAPKTARVRRDGVEIEIPAAHVLVGDIVIVSEGERIPVDGKVIEGRSTVDQSPLTGESLPIDKGPGEPVFSGTLNQFGRIEIVAERIGHQTTLGQVFKLVADAQKKKAPIERAADRYARYFLPLVETVTVLTIIAGLLLGWPDVWYRAVAILVVACPCALVLATPATVLAAMAWLARHGVLIKGGVALERLASCDTFAFDKTGTLTNGKPELASIVAFEGWSDTEVLRLAATAEQGSKHPLAALVNQAAREQMLEPFHCKDATAMPGAGVSVHWHAVGDDPDGPPHKILVGNRRLLEEHGITIENEALAALTAIDERGETPLLVAVDQWIVGLISARDSVRREAHDVVHDLKHLRITEVAILTGDRQSVAKLVGKKVHIKNIESELLPAGKAKWIEERQAAGRKVAMVGDGINDAPALAKANVGIALGAMGADLAAEAGDIVILGEPLLVLPDLVKLSRATVRIIRQNILGFAFGLNAVAMTSAALGILGPIAAAVLHQAGSFLVLVNAMRLLWFGDWRSTPPGRLLTSVQNAMGWWDDRFDLEHLADGVVSRWRGLVAVGLVCGVVYYLTSGWTAIGPDEVGLLQRNGRYLGTLEPGLHLRLPAPFERVTRVAPGRLRSVDVGFRTTARSGPAEAGQWVGTSSRGTVAQAEDESLVMTGDGQLVELAVSTQYHLDINSDALRQNVFRVANIEESLRSVVESAVRAEIGRRKLERLLTSERRAVELAALKEIQTRSDAYGFGLRIDGVAFQSMRPPQPVAAAYHDVSRAESDKSKRIKEGETYRLEQTKLAEGVAAVTRNAAESHKVTRSIRALGESEAFVARVIARAALPALTDHRLYWEAVAAVMAGKSKVVIDPDRSRARHLIFPDTAVGKLPEAVKSIVNDINTRANTKP